MRLLTAFAALASVALLAGCGGSTSVETQSGSAIPRSVAERLAASSESLADRLEAGDECGAAQLADDLKEAADEAISSGRIPVAYQDALEGAVTGLQDDVNCEQPAGPPDKEQGEGKGHGADHGEGKEKGHEKHEEDDDQEDDTASATTTTTTTTVTTTEDGG